MDKEGKRSTSSVLTKSGQHHNTKRKAGKGTRSRHSPPSPCGREFSSESERRQRTHDVRLCEVPLVVRELYLRVSVLLSPHPRYTHISLSIDVLIFSLFSLVKSPC